MKVFKGKVAVITGAASGIGRAIAERCAQEGMKVVLSDIEEDALAKTAEEMSEAGATVLAVLTDVSKADDVNMLARKTLDAFGAVHLVCNNAGVVGGASIWESTLADWEWVMGVNLWGVIHGARTFVPIMLEQATEGHIINVASMAGLTSYHGSGIYKVTKHGIITLSETLHHELVQQDAKIKVSVLCSGFVDTQIMDSERNRPDALKNLTVIGALDPEDEMLYKKLCQAVRDGMPPQQVADCVFQGIKDETFYILSDPQWKSKIQLRMEDILQERNPTDALTGIDIKIGRYPD